MTQTQQTQKKTASVKPNTNRLFQLGDKKLGVVLEGTFPSFEFSRHYFESAYIGKYEILEHPVNGEVKSHGVIFRDEENYKPNQKYVSKVEEYFQEKLM